MSKYALVTGASAGLGERFAHLLAKEGFNLVLVARDEVRLTANAQVLEKEFGVTCEVLSADLSTEAGLAQVEARLLDEFHPIEVLINNAGFGIGTGFLTSSMKVEEEMLDVLVKTPMRLMHSILPRMKANDSGTIINVSSVAGWIAGGSYSAAKSYLTVLSESLHTELRGSKVKVLALCPGFTHTEFHQRGNMRMDSLPSFMWLEADHVVKTAWADAQAGKAISVPGRQYKALSAITRFAPRPLVRRVGMSVRVKQRRK